MSLNASAILQSAARRMPFLVQAAVKKIPGVPALYRRCRTAARRPGPHFRRAPARFEALVREISNTPFRVVQDDAFRRGMRLDPGAPSSIRNAVIEINNTCNIDCLMCMTSLSTRKKGRMDAGTLELAVDRATEIGTREVELHTIGDPLANPRIADVLAVLRRHRVRTGIKTNGLLLHRHVDALLEYMDVCSSISFSIDGATAGTYERIRAGGKWAELLENLDLARTRLKPRGFRVRACMVVSRDNVHEIGLYIERFRAYVTDPAEDLTFSFVNSLSPDNKYFSATNLFPIHTYSTGPCSLVARPVPHTLVDGRVSVCCRDYDGSLVVGDIHQNSLGEIFRGDTMRAMQHAHASRDLSAYPLCATCFNVDRRVDSAFGELLAYLLFRFPDQPAEFYQARAIACIEMFQRGARADVTRSLFAAPQS